MQLLLPEAKSFQMKQTGIKGYWWYYTLTILAVAVVTLLSLILFWPLALAAVLGSLIFFTFTFGSFRKAVPRWITRWILIWPYSWGILRGLRE